MMTILRAILVVVCLSHLLLGAIAFFAVPDMVTGWTAAIYGATVTLTPALQHSVRIIGAFMLAIGVMAGFALRDPARNRAIIDGIGILQLLRVAQRVVFAAQVQETFGVSSSRLVLQSVFFLALGLALLLLRPPARPGARA